MKKRKSPKDPNWEKKSHSKKQKTSSRREGSTNSHNDDELLHDYDRRQGGGPWSKSKKKRMRQLKAKLKRKGLTKGTGGVKSNDETTTKKVESNNESPPNLVKTKPSSLQKSFQERLSGSRFRILNEELYTTTSSAAYHRFSSNPKLYEQYHEGFRRQVEQWPVNPVHVIVKSLKALVATSNKQQHQQHKYRQYVVADFGCGDAELAKQLLNVKNKKNGKCPFQVHSFDLVASCNLVTACDMANVPLATGTVDVAVFCLSLMGTNLADFIREAHRVLKEDGTGRLKIAEVRSRFESRKDELDDFLGVLDQLGFRCIKNDRSNKMFVLLELEKNGKKPKKDLAFTAKPCIYKRR